MRNIALWWKLRKVIRGSKKLNRQKSEIKAVFALIQGFLKRGDSSEQCAFEVDLFEKDGGFSMCVGRLAARYFRGRMKAELHLFSEEGEFALITADSIQMRHIPLLRSNLGRILIEAERQLTGLTHDVQFLMDR